MSAIDAFVFLGQKQVTPQKNEPAHLFAEFKKISLEHGPQPIYYWAASNLWFLQRKLSASTDSIRGAVAIDLRIMHGNPVFLGSRIPIYEIVEELADGTTLSELAEGYPSLTAEQIQHGLDFAASLLRI